MLMHGVMKLSSRVLAAFSSAVFCILTVGGAFDAAVSPPEAAPSPTPALPMTEFGDIDISHDFPQNDPSVGPMLTLDKEIPQWQVLASEVASDLVPFRREHADLDSLPKTKAYAQLLAEDPAAFEVLKLHASRYVPQERNGPTLVNANHEFAGISDRAFGYCWGFATLVRYFETLAFWDPRPAADAPWFGDRKAWVAYYRLKINAIIAGEATVVPGFPDFRAFSLVPEIELELKKAAMHLWKTRIVQGKTPGIFRNSTTVMTAEQRATLVSELKARLARGEMPKILFTAMLSEYVKVMGIKLGSKDIHASLVHHVRETADGAVFIDLWDINFYAETQEKKPVYIEIRPNGEVRFWPWYESKHPGVPADQSTLLGQVILAPEGDRETVQMVRSLGEFCAAKPEYCNGRY